MWGLPEVTLADLVDDAVRLPCPIILDHCCLPPYEGPSDHDDLVPLLKTAMHLKPSIIVELGTGFGNAVANLCQVCDARIYTVNALPHQVSGRVTTFTLPQEEIGCVYRKYGYGHRVVQIYSDTMRLKLRDYLPRPSVDLAIVDACHDTPYVINDFLRIAPYMKDDGMILLHDTHPSMEGHLAGSYKACMVLRRHGYDIRYMTGTWWGVWTKNGCPGHRTVV
jgi:predicted O-methyltransferase YrrM